MPRATFCTGLWGVICLTGHSSNNKPMIRHLGEGCRHHILSGGSSLLTRLEAWEGDLLDKVENIIV